MTQLPGVFAVTGPVQAEIIALALVDATIVLTGPCGAAPWYVQLGQEANPTKIVAAIARANLGEPVVLHSTSWRHARGGVVLTYVAVIDPARATGLETAPIGRADLARGQATSEPARVPAASVIEHGLRHLAWLAKDDPVVEAALPAGWHAALAAYRAEPFRQL
jgi:hypothetical protein